MMELLYIPLKTADGSVCGYACARGGAVTLSLRSHLGGDAYLFTAGGAASGPVQFPIRVTGTVEGVAVLRGGLLYCSGFPRNSPMDITALRARLRRMQAPPEPSPVRPFPAREKAAPPPAPVPLFPSPPEPEPEAFVPTCKPSPQTLAKGGEEAAPVFDPDEAMTKALQRLADTAAEAFFPAAKKESPSPMPDGAEKAAVFSALLTRADAVFAKASALPENPAPAPVPPDRSLEEPAPEELWFKAYLKPDPAEEPRKAPVKPPRQFFPPDWAGEVDALLSGSRETPVRRTPAENPFPHIFPDAHFQREEGPDGQRLLGQWRRGGDSFSITAVQGDYSPQPPAHLMGFTRYIRTRSGGFWVRVEDSE